MPWLIGGAIAALVAFFGIRAARGSGSPLTKLSPGHWYAVTFAVTVPQGILSAPAASTQPPGPVAEGLAKGLMTLCGFALPITAMSSPGAGMSANSQLVKAIAKYAGADGLSVSSAPNLQVTSVEEVHPPPDGVLPAH
jgi:hypothetical protein